MFVGTGTDDTAWKILTMLASGFVVGMLLGYW